MAGLKIIGTGMSIPEKTVTNDDLGKIIDTSDEWIYSRTGIKKRHFVKEGESAQLLAVRASKKAIEKACLNDREFSADKIKAVFAAEMTSGYVYPSVACILQKELNLRNDIKAFDISAACTGFLYALQSAYEFLNTIRSGYVLIAGAECMSGILDFTDRSTCVLFGDGAGAAVVKWDDSRESVFFEIFGTYGNVDDLYCETGGYTHMNGGAVYKFATTSLASAIDKLLQDTGLSIDDIDQIVCHQANARIINSVKRKFPGNDNKFFTNIDEFANTSAASVAIAMSDMYEREILKPGMKIICAAFGAGLSWNAVLMTV